MLHHTFETVYFSNVAHKVCLQRLRPGKEIKIPVTTELVWQQIDKNTIATKDGHAKIVICIPND